MKLKPPIQKLISFAFALSIVFVSFSCGDDDDGGTQIIDTDMVASVNGEEWQGSATADTTSIPGRVVVVGTNIQDQSLIQLSFLAEEGSYGLGGLDASASFTNANGLALLGQSGNLTISSLSNTQISGTFSFEAEDVSGAESLSISQGSFTVDL